MSFPRYPNYKPSDVEWLGDVPAHWEIKPLKHVAMIDSCGCYGVEPEEGQIVLPVATTAQIGSDGRFVVDEMPRRGFTSADIKRFACSDGDILVVKSSGSATNIISGKAGLVDERTPTFVFSNFLMRVRPMPECATSKFIYAQLRSHLTRQRIELMCSSTTYPNLQVGQYTSASLPIPPLVEQSRIAEFLDRETAKTDELVAEQRRLMELLKEKRQAVISHAVTRGLNPQAPLKPSGIEWLDDIPSHWRALKFQRCVHVAEGQVDPEAAEFSAMPLIAPNHIESGTGRLLGLESASDQGAESGKYLCRKGDVVYSKIRPALRKVCIAPADCLCSADMYPLRAHSGLTNVFLLWAMLSEQFSAFAVLESERVAMPKINRESLKEVMFAVPPPAEQTEIVRHIEIETAKFDALTAEAQRAIDLLQERRTALISAAVTGQIDVRETAEDSAEKFLHAAEAAAPYGARA